MAGLGVLLARSSGHAGADHCGSATGIDRVDVPAGPARLLIETGGLR